jgi:RecJ-like exonuclease
MKSHEIIALRCPSCGGGPSEPSREMPFGAEFRCDHCGVTSVLIIDRALVPLSTLQRQGEKVCIACGRMALREARFCQEGHALVQRCTSCSKEFAVDHQRCDFCGRLPSEGIFLHGIYQGTVSRIVDFGAFVEIIPGNDALLHISEIANHPVKDVRDELKEGEQISVKIIQIDGNKIKVSSKALGRP